MRMQRDYPFVKAVRHRAGFRLECPYCARAHTHPTIGFHLSGCNDRASRKGYYVIMTAADIDRIKHSIVLAPL